MSPFNNYTVATAATTEEEEPTADVVAVAKL